MISATFSVFGTSHWGVAKQVTALEQKLPSDPALITGGPLGHPCSFPFSAQRPSLMDVKTRAVSPDVEAMLHHVPLPPDDDDADDDDADAGGGDDDDNE